MFLYIFIKIKKLKKRKSKLSKIYFLNEQKTSNQETISEKQKLALKLHNAFTITSNIENKINNFLNTK